MTELLKVGDAYIREGVGNTGSYPSPTETFTIVRIVPLEGTDPNDFSKSLGENQSVVTGKNMLDDPRNAGRFDPNMVYVFES